MPNISVFAKPGSKQASRLELQPDGSYIAYIHAKAHDGEANKAVVELVAREFKVAKTSIVITSGQKSRHKIISY